jgi:hypothetical protein
MIPLHARVSSHLVIVSRRLLSLAAREGWWACGFRFEPTVCPSEVLFLLFYAA